MNENQRAFLDELGELFEKYAIYEMCVNNDNTVDFMSNGQSLRTRGFSDGIFEDVRGIVGDYEPRREGVNDAP